MLSHEAVRGSRPDSRERQSFMSRYPALQSPGREADDAVFGGGVRPSTSESMLHRPPSSSGFVCTQLSDLRAEEYERQQQGSLSPEQHELRNLSYSREAAPARAGNVYYGKGPGRSDLFWNRLSSYYSAEDHPVRSQAPGLPESPGQRQRRAGTPELTHHAVLDERGTKAVLPLRDERATTPPHMRKKSSFFKCTDGRAGHEVKPVGADRVKRAPSHRKSLQNLHRSRAGQYSRGEPRKCPTSPVRHRDPNERLRQAPGSPEQSMTSFRSSSFGGPANGALSSNCCPFKTSHKFVVFEDCEPGATYEAWLEVTNISGNAVLMKVSAPSDKRFARSKTRRHGVVAPGLTSLLHICFESGADTVHGEVINDSIRIDAPAGEWMIVPLRATMAPRSASEHEGHIVGGNVAAAVAESGLGSSIGDGRASGFFAPGQSVGEYFGEMDLPMGASTTPSGATAGWVPGEEFWGEDVAAGVGMDPASSRQSMQQRGRSGGGPRVGVKVKSAQYTGGLRKRPGSIAVPHAMLEPRAATAAAARVLAARRDRYSDTRHMSRGVSGRQGGAELDGGSEQGTERGQVGLADFHGSVGSLVPRPSTGTLTTVRRCAMLPAISVTASCSPSAMQVAPS